MCEERSLRSATCVKSPGATRHRTSFLEKPLRHARLRPLNEGVCQGMHASDSQGAVGDVDVAEVTRSTDDTAQRSGTSNADAIPTKIEALEVTPLKGFAKHCCTHFGYVVVRSVELSERCVCRDNSCKCVRASIT